MPRPGVNPKSICTPMIQTEFLASTFSIVAYDPHAQEWGVAVQSKAFTVGGIVPWARAGVGAVATQATTNMQYGPRGLALLERGLSPLDVIEYLVSRDKGGARRQLALVDAEGHAANYTGNECIKWAGGFAAEDFSVQGNILAGERVITAMARAFQSTQGKLAERLLAALVAGQRAGGDTRGQQSAALLVVRAQSDINGVGDHYVDLRVDDHKTPIVELQRLYEIWETNFYPLIESERIRRLLREKKYASAQHAHREFVAKVERIARKHPSDADFNESVASCLAENDLGLDAALRYAKRAAKLKPKSARFQNTLAEVYYRRGEYERAVDIQRSLAHKHPDNEDAQKKLAQFERAEKRFGRK